VSRIAPDAVAETARDIFPKELAWTMMRFMLWTKEYRGLTHIRRKVSKCKLF
jgi:hypothetical protein